MALALPCETGTEGGDGIKVEAGKQKTVYVRWPEDPGLAVILPAE